MTELSDYKRLVERPQLKALGDEIAWLKSALVSVVNSCNSDHPPTYASLAEIARRGLEGPQKPDSVVPATVKRGK